MPRLFKTGLLGWLAVAAMLVPAGAETLTWRRCLETALHSNPRLIQAERQIREAEGTDLATRAVLLPSLESTLLTIPPVAIFDFRQSVFNLPDWKQAGQSRSEVVVARVNYEVQLWNLVEGLRAAYLQVNYQQKVLGLRILYVEDLDKSLSTVSALFKAGRARAVDVRRLEVNLSLARADVEQVRIDLDNARLVLLSLMGLRAEDLPLVGQVENVLGNDPPEKVDDEAYWTEIALRLRPDLRLMAAMNTSGNWLLERVKYAGFPVVVALGHAELAPDTGDVLGSLTQRVNDDNEDVSSEVSFGAGFGWRIWDGGERRGQKQSVQAGLEKLDVSIRQLKTQAIPSQVRQALGAVRAAEASLKAVDRPELARQYQAEAEALAEAGTISQLEALEASRDRLKRQELNLQAQFRLELARLALQTATGQQVVYEDPAFRP